MDINGFLNRLSLHLKRNWAIYLLIFSYVVIALWNSQISDLLGQSGAQQKIGEAVYEGWLGLVDYLSAHVLLCLVPAFFIAGAMNTLMGIDQIVKYLGAKSKKWLAYIIASVGGFFIEVCSCTILPLFAGIWKRGAGLGIAVTFLYAGPAINVISFMLTGTRIGWDFAIVRLILSITFSIAVGLIMGIVFRKDAMGKDGLSLQDSKHSLHGNRSKIFWISLFAILLVGTAPIDSNIKYMVISLLSLFQIYIAFSWLKKEEIHSWWDETIRFFTDIIPLLLVGVFFASFFTYLIPQDLFQSFAGQNTLLTNFAAVMFGAIAYFPALVEVPIAENFMRLGMHKGPLMAYMLADPVLSLQGLLVISKIIGRKKTLVYAISIIILTTFAGYFYGSM